MEESANSYSLSFFFRRLRDNFSQELPTAIERNVPFASCRELQAAPPRGEFALHYRYVSSSSYVLCSSRRRCLVGQQGGRQDERGVKMSRLRQCEYVSRKIWDGGKIMTSYGTIACFLSVRGRPASRLLRPSRPNRVTSHENQASFMVRPKNNKLNYKLQRTIQTNDFDHEGQDTQACCRVSGPRMFR
jgi:hypothetical protein